ncbi:MAG: DUF1761 domain-containing protein [Chloroflexi bacterium]|nr:MAG: DUF1761 domain-containing protein [Chloroflexota bacterium]MBL1194742.1 DUF1761 domain-containing protein [Chloroflexota bacterium]NOH12035.1 DUF1761 domain-containing protein [Chloroflexota bacterium]
MPPFDINWIGVIIALVVNMIIGAVWYGVFANPWMAAIGKTREEIEGDQDWRAYGVAGLNSLIMPIVMGFVLNWAGASGIGAGLTVGFIVWLGFMAMPVATNYAFAGQPRNLWFIDAGYHLVSFLVIGGLLGAL